MFKKRKLKWFIFFISICLILTACTETKLLERISIVTLIGYDKEEDLLSATAVVRQINPEFQSNIEIHSETAATSKESKLKVDLEIAKKLGTGQLRVVLFGDDLAKEGLEEAVHTIAMNPEMATSIYLSVVRENKNITRKQV
ncbi:hypothetical protein H9636_10965 [Ureibacillus sp. Re31]|uniref:Spore germination protein N-terminal domain-containing protein n=1 Tax=Ureibacillus galli TaxID=2762222 RepID=A0ABR8XD68_9BACL|nr:hypothetical protein [Ureibacillus galli]MBD8027175.1 hypothetical protein [Ureibacillus galli]